MKNVRRLKLLQKALLLIVLLGIAIAGLIFAGIPKRASAIVIVAPGSGKDLKVTISVCYPGDGPSYESRYSSSDVNASLFYVGSKDNIVISLDGDGGIIEHVGFKWFYGDDTGVVGDANAAFTDKTTKIWKVSDWLTGAHVHDILAIQCYYLSDLFGTTTEARYYFNFKIDSTAPAVSMSNEYYNANDSTYYIKNAQTMTFSDSESGFSRSEIKKNSEASVTSPASAYTFSSSGTYTVTVIDRVDNKSVYTVKYDDQLPTGKFTNSSAVEIADYTRDPFRFVFSDIGDSGVKTSTLTRPGQAPEDYTSGYIQQNAADGRYTFTVTDYANNVLIKSIVFDTETPEGVFENAQLLPASAEYYARTDQTARFSWTAATPSEAPVSATLDGQSYASGTAITAAGRHAVVIRDAVNHSRTYYLTIDKTLPTGRFTDYYGVELSLYTSDDFRFVFSDSGGSGLKSGTLMRPGEEAKDYTAYTNISASSGDGLYVFTVEDYAGNVLTKSIVLDTTAPAGVFDKAQLLPNKTDEYYAKSTDTARFSWTAATPSEAPVSVTLDEQSYAINTPIAGAGRHTVVISDGAGNKTTYYLIIDKTAPTGRITDNSGAELEAYTRGSFRFTFSDSGGSGLKSATLTRPGQAPEDYTAYTNISASSGDGLYVFTVEDYAGNVFSRSITLDITAPTAIVKNAAGNSVTDYINAAFRLFGEDITSPVTCQIKTPGGAWTAHTAGTYIDPASGDGLYEFRVTDDAGNTSTVNITLDTVTPEITLNPNTSIYNKQIIFTASDINFSGIYYRNGGGAYSFTSAKSYTVAATSANNAAWSFYAADAAGNNSAVRTIILDTVAAVHGSLPEYTKDNITFAPTDLNGIAETYYRFGAAGGYTAASGVSVTVSAVSENLGEWWFYARDNAGNDSAPQRVVMSIVSTFGNREQISNGYKITGWYNVTLPARVFTTTNKDEAGIYSFADYATALRFAFAKETEYRVSALSDSWVYLSASNENVAQVYTDRAALDAAVEKYAKTYISAEQRYINGKNNYYTPVNGTLSLDPAALTRQELVLPSFLSYFGLPALQCQPDYKFTRLSPGYATAPSGVSLRYVADDVHAVTEEAFGITYGVTVISALASKRQGYYLVTESDAAGNEERYIIYLDRQAPVVTVSVTFGDGGNVCITFDESYLADYAGTLYYCAVDFQTVFDNDNYYCLKITGRNLNKTFLQGETLPNLNTADFSGKYTVELYDRSLNTLQFEIVVSNEPPRMSTSALSSDTECRLAVVIPDSFNAITKLQLFKILYDGSYQEVFQDDNGTTVSFLNLTYTLRTGGKYTMRFTDLFGRDIEAAPVFFTKGLPKAVLSGVADGGITNRNVSLRYSGEDTLTAYAWADGIKTVFTDYTTTYQNNTDTYTAVITANAETSHEYVFLLFKTDDRNLFVEYGFEIDCVIAELNILDIGKNTIPYDGATNKAFYITWSETLTLNYYTSRTVGGALGAVKYNQGTVLSQNGIYYFSLRDSVGNTKDFTVLLDDYVSFEIKGAYTVIAANRFIAKNELTVTILEAVAVFNVTNADNYVIGNGGTLKFDGMYVIYAVDNYGNGITLYIELDTVPPVIVLSGVEPGGIVRGVVTVNFLGYSEAYTVDGRDKILQKITDGAVFAEHGKYRITAQDVAGNKTTVEFDIDIKVDYVFSLENGAFTTDRASLVFSEPLSEISVTLNGAPAEAGERFVDLGAYAVFARDIAGNTVSITFTVIPARAQRLELPIAAEWRLERAEMNGRTAALTADDDKLTLEENGVYVLTFGNPQTNAAFTVTVTIDHEPPTVEITQESKNGVIIGAASKDNVSFALTRDGKEVAFKKTLSDPGQYKLVVIDDIGNVNVYEFTISYRMNAFAVVLSVIGALILLATVFLIARARRKPAVK